MYSSMLCPFCRRAEMLLSQKQADVEIKLVDGDAAARQEMMTLSGRHTVPQIFIGDTHVGGCDELYALEQRGQLDALLQAA
jgi:glutaredoxin 3